MAGLSHVLSCLDLKQLEHETPPAKSSLNKLASSISNSPEFVESLKAHIKTPPVTLAMIKIDHLEADVRYLLDLMARFKKSAEDLKKLDKLQEKIFIYLSNSLSRVDDFTRLRQALSIAMNVISECSFEELASLKQMLKETYFMVPLKLFSYVSDLAAIYKELAENRHAKKSQIVSSLYLVTLSALKSFLKTQDHEKFMVLSNMADSEDMCDVFDQVASEYASDPAKLERLKKNASKMASLFDKRYELKEHSLELSTWATH